MKKLILVLFVCVMMASVLVACNSVDDEFYTQPNFETPTTNEENKSVDYVKEKDTPNVNISYDMSLVADLYLAIGERGEADSIYLDVTDGKLAIGETLFDQVTYGQNVEVKYAEAYNCYDPEISIKYNGTVCGTDDEKEILTLMMRISQQKNCYLLKSSTDNEIAGYIAAYHLDGVCYLCLFDENGLVSKVYYMKVEYEEPILTDGMEIKAKTFAIWEALSSGGSVILNVVGDEIYHFDDLFEIKYYNEIKINKEWCRENIWFWETDQSTGMAVLDKINQENGCFVIYHPDVEEYEYELAIFVVDDVYYFIDVTKGYRRGVCITRMYYCPENE